MEDSQKPFACTLPGCEMTFTNEDHLHWHIKRHDMVLNLGLTSKNSEIADQTPTPTRFIRNCEEVGLFQDLQNVNPFDETFKKAIEDSKSGTLHVPTASNDDTLHTPHIFPPVETPVDSHSTQSNDFCINSVPTIHVSDESDLTIVTDEIPSEIEKSKNLELKTKLKETIRNKNKAPIVIPIPLAKLKENQIPILLNKLNKRQNQSGDKSGNKKENSVTKKQKTDKAVDTDVDKEKMRESNRAAQNRCRNRKKQKWKVMEEEIKTLKCQNVKLNHENQNFKHKLYCIKESLIKYKKDNEVKDVAFVSGIEDILNSTAPIPVVSPKLNEQKTLKFPINKNSPIVPVAMIQNPGQTKNDKPIVIQVMGSVAQVAVSVLPTVK